MTSFACSMFAATALAIATPLAAQAPPPPAASESDRQLQAIYEAFSLWGQKEYGYYEDPKGENQPAAYLPRVDAANQLRRAEYFRSLLSQVKAIPETRLSPDERVNASVLATILETSLADAAAREWEMPVNSDSNFWTYHDERDPLDDAAAYKRYIARMRDLPRYFDEQAANMRAGLKRGFTPPAATLQGRDGSIEAFTRSGEQNAFFAAFKTMPQSISATDQAALRVEAMAAIDQAVIPAYRKLLAFWSADYVPGARQTISARDLPNGDAYYRSEIREYTTLGLSPEEIHQIGLGEVARIDADMRRTMAESGFKGSFEEFLKFLRTDPQFYASTPEELLGVSAYVAKRVDGRLDEFFDLLPRRRFTIIPVPEALAPFYTAGRGGLESCQMNTHNLPVRPLYNIPALTLHECVPGHSFQAGLAEERRALPDFRRNVYFSGYGEGWGLYVEWLGNLMGIYRTPYERFGQQSYEMWRAARLVIDTGIHRYGWSRVRAIDYLASHTALSQHEVETEVDRYISWPGQALSYKLGELTIRRLRGEAEKELGTSFDQRKFHDLILALGSVPLPVLEERVREFIASNRS